MLRNVLIWILLAAILLAAGCSRSSSQGFEPVTSDAIGALCRSTLQAEANFEVGFAGPEADQIRESANRVSVGVSLWEGMSRWSENMKPEFTTGLAGVYSELAKRLLELDLDQDPDSLREE